MRVELGAHVRTSDGKDVGKIDRFVLDPSTGQVKSAVVRKGFILTDDVEIPIESLQDGDRDEVVLSCTEKQVEDLPRFSEEAYTTPPVAYVPPLGYPPDGLLWPMGYPLVGTPSAADLSRAEKPEYDEMLRKLDFENAVVGPGSDVVAVDGEKVGDLHQIVFDTATRRPTGFIVRKGFLFTEDLDLPVSSIASMDDGVIYLSLDKDQVREYERVHR